MHVSIAEITRKCFQRDIVASEWLGICLFVQGKDNVNRYLGDHFENDLSNSILVLFQSYPADPLLLSYISYALESTALSFSTFLTSFLQAAASTGLQDTTTLDMLCKLIREHHYSSESSARGSSIQNGVVTVGLIQDGIYLLRNVLSLPISPFHALITSASELLIILLTCAGDMTQIPAGQAMVSFMDVHSLLQNPRLAGPVRTLLENFALSLSMSLGDDAKLVQETQFMQTQRFTTDRVISEAHSTSSLEIDNISCGLLLDYLVKGRGKTSGAGNTVTSVAMLIATFRRNVWTPSLFYKKLLHSAALCLSQAKVKHDGMLIWKSFIISRLSQLLAVFEQVVSSDASAEIDWVTAKQEAIGYLHSSSELLAECDFLPGMSGSGVYNTRFLPALLQFYFQRSRTVNAEFITRLDASIISEFTPRLFKEPIRSDVELESFIETKLFSDNINDDTSDLIERIIHDFSCHGLFSELVQKKFLSLTHAFDVEGLSHLCRILLLDSVTTDIISIHVKMVDILTSIMIFFEDCDCETVGDPQSVFSRFGDVVLFLQWTIFHFGLNNTTFKFGERVLHPTSLLTTSTVYKSHELTTDDSAALSNWTKALFDSASEGIEDNILRSTKPRILLKLSATLVIKAVRNCSEGRMEPDVLKNGVSYFKGPLLNWTLVGVIKASIAELRNHHSVFPMCLEVVKSLLQTEPFPAPILRLTAYDISRLVNDPEVQLHLHRDQFSSEIQHIVQKLRTIDKSNIRNSTNKGSLTKFADIPRAEVSDSSIDSPLAHWLDRARKSIRDVLVASRLDEAPSLDVGRCIAFNGAVHFLSGLWQELSAIAHQGDTEMCRQLAAFVLTCPPSPDDNVPPLLPIFLHIVVPSLILDIDRQVPAEQATSISLLVNIIISSLIGISHMEWVMRALEGEVKQSVGQASASIARRLQSYLRYKSSPASIMIFERLVSSTSFITSFPVFVSG